MTVSTGVKPLSTDGKLSIPAAPMWRRPFLASLLFSPGLLFLRAASGHQCPCFNLLVYLPFQKFFNFFLQWREFTEVVREDYGLVNTSVTSYISSLKNLFFFFSPHQNKSVKHRKHLPQMPSGSPYSAYSECFILCWCFVCLSLFSIYNR